MNDPKPTRIGMTIGATTRNGGEFEFKKISLSLDRDLGALENSLDGFRDVKALLERMLSEFQASKPVSRGIQESETQQTNHETLRVETLKPGHPGENVKPGLSLEIVRKRLDAWCDKVEVSSGLDGSFNVTPKHYLHPETWRSINEAVRGLDGKWVSNGKAGSWRIPK